MRRWLLIGVGALAVLFVLIQAVPYGRSHTNPPVSKEPAWDSAATRQLAKDACFDCHSNETVWKWYTNIAPISWLTQNDVNGGRSSLNFSEWDKPQDGAGDAIEAARSGSMPPWFYPLMHPNASLNAQERLQLANGLAATFRRSPPIGGVGG